MFVSFIESEKIPRGLHMLDGATVSILKPLTGNFYTVSGFTSRGEERTWDAHTDELVGFDPQELVA
jgi:hypothetical protein